MLKLVFDKESCSKQNFFVLRCFRSGERLDFSNKSFITSNIETFREYVLTKKFQTIFCSVFHSPSHRPPPFEEPKTNQFK